MPNIESLSPMMQHYMQVKEQYPDCFVFYRLGDFYEMFFEDAVEGSKIMELTLTGRDCGLKERAPMCGVPYHSVDSYVQKMIDHGKKVAICEQMEDPALAKGLVEREVIRVITPGTLIEEKLLDSGRNNYIMSLYYSNDGIGYAFSDISTGVFATGQCSLRESEQVISEEFSRLTPSECIANESFINNSTLTPLFRSHSYLEKLPDSIFRFARAEALLKEHYNTISLDGFGFCDNELAVSAAGALLQYLLDTQKNNLHHLNRPYIIHREGYMHLDAITRKNLEITENIRGGDRNKFSLFGLLDRTQTASGKRLLRSYIDLPLYSVDSIYYRQNAVNELFASQVVRLRLRETLSKTYDIERLCSKIAYKTINPKDCIAIAKTLSEIPVIIDILSHPASEAVKSLFERLDPCTELKEYLEKAIDPDSSTVTKDGGYIRSGFSSEVDELRSIASNSQSWLDSILEHEREETGIKNLRIGFNKVFGYFLEVTKSYVNLVPDRYERKQTLTNAERYITPELKEIEHKLLTAEDELIRLEASLFEEVRNTLFGNISALETNAACIAEADVYQSLATCAVENGYVCPEIADDGIIDIVNGRHPIVEKSISGGFIANDVLLNTSDNRLLIITGPNMAGKSTFMRQTALIVVMACIGSFVPASKAHICLVDRIFTRIGASDDLSSGQSTFMVEMNEVANIINNATQKSLLILDEIGRGTSTYDGLSIAWAVLERLASVELCGAKALFATHYHELSELEGKLDGVKNFRVMVKEYGDDILFLRKITRGSADKSFGIQVAKLSGIPEDVIARAKQILSQLENSDVVSRPVISAEEPNTEVENVNNVKVLQDILSINTDSITPLEALNKLCQYKDILKYR